MNPSNQLIYSASVIDLLTVSAQYCVFLEKLTTAGTTRRQFLDQITKLLPLIYVKASLLPRQELFESGLLPEVVTETDYDEVRNAVWRLLGGDDEYLEVFTQDMQYSEGPMTRTISEDLADIYQDLKNFASVYADRNEEAMLEAVATVGENFRQYWGQRLVNAMRPLHVLRYDEEDEDENEDDTLRYEDEDDTLRYEDETMK